MAIPITIDSVMPPIGAAGGPITWVTRLGGSFVTPPPPRVGEPIEHCPDHALGAYRASVRCAECRLLIKKWLLWAITEVPSCDAIAMRGTSGQAFGYWLADTIGADIIVVGKNGEQSHGSKVLASNVDTSPRYVIIDDFVDTGDTAVEMVNDIKGPHPGSELVGILLYHSKTYLPQKVKALGVPVIQRAVTSRG